jgi:hypothetical protein
MTACMGLQEGCDDIYKRNITKIQKFKNSKKLLSKKSFSQPNLRYKQHLNYFLLNFIIIKHCVGKKCKERLGGSLIGSYKYNDSIFTISGKYFSKKHLKVLKCNKKLKNTIK